MCTNQSLVRVGLGFEQLLQITEHPLVTFVVPQAVKQGAKARFAVRDKSEQVALATTAIKDADHHSWCKTLLSRTPINY